MIDTKTRKGEIMAAMVTGLAVGHALHDDRASAQVPGAATLGHLLILGCSLANQRAAEMTFDPDKSDEENAKALWAVNPNTEMEAALNVLTYEQLVAAMRVGSYLEGTAAMMMRTIQRTAQRKFPDEFHRDAAELLGMEIMQPLVIVDLRTRPPQGPPGKPEPLTS